MYTLLLYIHVLALVYWLGGDLGTYLSSRHVLRSDLTVESRQTAFKILMECDMGPRLAMPIILGSGCHLAALRWPTVLPAEVALVGWLTVAVWVALVLVIHSDIGHRMPSLTQWDLRLRFAVVFATWRDRHRVYGGITRLDCDQDRCFCCVGRLRYRCAICAETFCIGLHADDQRRSERSR